MQYSLTSMQSEVFATTERTTTRWSCPLEALPPPEHSISLSVLNAIPALYRSWPRTNLLGMRFVHQKSPSLGLAIAFLGRGADKRPLASAC